MGIVNALFKTARRAADLKALTSGDRRRVQRRLKNKAVGRLAARRGLWGRLWH